MTNNNVNEIIGFHLPNEPHGCFSNWFDSQFTYAGKQYCCAEQYMMAQKVAMGRRLDLYYQIMDTKDPETMKCLADKDHYPEFLSIMSIWNKNCRHIVKRGVKAKFQQNPDMLKELLNTGNALLCECASQDKIWGIGINLHNPAWHRIINWNGSNYLGIILMEVREELRRELREKRSVEYIDFTAADPIPEWEMFANQLKRIPQYFNAVHAYGDTLQTKQEWDAFHNDYSLYDWEIAMATNMGGGLPVSGFFEMKQEIYEIAFRLGNR